MINQVNHGLPAAQLRAIPVPVFRPTSEANESVIERKEGVATRIRTDRRALVASPDRAFLQLATSALSLFRPGYDVATASSLSGAKEWFASLKPRIFIVDCELAEPGSLISDDELFRGAQAILITADGEDSQLAEEGDGWLTLTKPVTLPDLLMTVREVRLVR